MRKALNIWAPIGLLALILCGVYLKQWATTARAIGTAHDAQENDIALLSRALKSLQDISALQMALRVKLFGPGAAEEAVLSANSAPKTAPVLPPSVVAAMNRNAVKLVSYRQSGTTSNVQFEGSYESVVRFLSAAGPDMPRVDGFMMERAAGSRVKLTLSLSPRSV